MTTPAPPPAQQQQTSWPAGVWPLRRILYVVGCALFVIGAFAFGGHALASIPGGTWDSAAFAAWILAWAVP